MKLRAFLIGVVTITLALVILGVMGTLLVGLFDDHVDNKQIFETIKPAFQMIVGAFIGIVARDALDKVL